MLVFLIIFRAIVEYLILGYLIGHYSWKFYHQGQEKKDRRWLRFLLWPFSTVIDIPAPRNAFTPPQGIDDFETQKGYASSLSLVWGIKVFWNLVLIIIFGIVYFLYFVARGIFYSARKIAKINDS